MKVLHVSPSISSAYGGPTASLVGYLSASRAAGLDASVAAPEPLDSDLAAFASELASNQLHLFSSFGRGAAVLSPSLWRWLARECRRYDIVHVHGLFNPISSLAARIAIRSAVPTVIRPFGTMSRYTAFHRRARLKSLYMAAVERPNIERAAALHFTTETERREANWRGIDIGPRGFVVPPPYIGPVGAPPAPLQDPVVLFLGRIHPVKNIEALLSAWPQVVRDLPNAQLVIAGDGDDRYVGQLRARVKEIGAASKVTFTGAVSGSAKEALFERASLLALVSHHENFGMVALEAIARGLPVVLGDGVQIAARLEAAGVGRRVKTDALSLGDGILAVLRDKHFRGHCRAAGPQIARTQFSVTACGQQLAAMYHDILSRGNLSHAGRAHV